MEKARVVLPEVEDFADAPTGNFLKAILLRESSEHSPESLSSSRLETQFSCPILSLQDRQ